MREGKLPPAGREWCGPRTARGGERSVYGTGAALRPGAPSVGGGAIGELGAGNDGGGAGGERQEGRSQGAGDPTQPPTDPFVNRWTNPHGLPRAHQGGHCCKLPGRGWNFYHPNTLHLDGAIQTGRVLTITPSTHREDNPTDNVASAFPCTSATNPVTHVSVCTSTATRVQICIRLDQKINSCESHPSRLSDN